MRQISKEELKSLLDKSSDELHRKIDCHYAWIASMLERVSGDGICLNRPHESAFGREGRLKAAFIETIQVLEETRKAFKSKKLESLRKKLTRVLIDAE